MTRLFFALFLIPLRNDGPPVVATFLYATFLKGRPVGQARIWQSVVRVYQAIAFLLKANFD